MAYLRGGVVYGEAGGGEAGCQSLGEAGVRSGRHQLTAGLLHNRVQAGPLPWQLGVSRIVDGQGLGWNESTGIRPLQQMALE